MRISRQRWRQRDELCLCRAPCQISPCMVYVCVMYVVYGVCMRNVCSVVCMPYRKAAPLDRRGALCRRCSGALESVWGMARLEIEKLYFWGLFRSSSSCGRATRLIRGFALLHRWYGHRGVCRRPHHEAKEPGRRGRGRLGPRFRVAGRARRRRPSIRRRCGSWCFMP